MLLHGRWAMKKHDHWIFLAWCGNLTSMTRTTASTRWKTLSRLLSTRMGGTSLRICPGVGSRNKVRPQTRGWQSQITHGRSNRVGSSRYISKWRCGWAITERSHWMVKLARRSKIANTIYWIVRANWCTLKAIKKYKQLNHWAYSTSKQEKTL